jgi:hypothetical protein
MTVPVSTVAAERNSFMLKIMKTYFRMLMAQRRELEWRPLLRLWNVKNSWVNSIAGNSKNNIFLGQKCIHIRCE